jgi:hypothetical protein
MISSIVTRLGSGLGGSTDSDKGYLLVPLEALEVVVQARLDSSRRGTLASLTPCFGIPDAQVGAAGGFHGGSSDRQVDEPQMS